MALHCACQRKRGSGQLRAQIFLRRADQFGGSGRRRCAHVGGPVGNREIGFMANTGHHRQRTRGNRARHRLVVECPQVFDRAAATAHDQYFNAVHHRARARRLDRRRQRRRRARALHRCRIQHHGNHRRTPRQRGHHIAQRRRLQRGDDADAARQRRQGALARGVKQAFGCKLFLEPQELLKQGTRPGAPHRLDTQLVFAARLEQRHCRAHLDRITVLRLKRQRAGLAAPERAAHLGGGVLKREIQMPGGGACEAGNFAAHVDAPDTAFEQLARAAVQVRHRTGRVLRHAHARAGFFHIRTAQQVNSFRHRTA